ncbi:phage tail protein [Limnobaculum parvum]|uniref:Phage tail protein n=1 Tax=Limnobaculum parvum TaxID=2172103 RepID=A0A2Y9TWD1_9GAMM|nr:phage tail protein [Limnobaculum parvum]AWH88013.1 phage tail protein [Limnobaculum parvum]
MALTTEQEQALLALLDENKITLSELPAATDLSAEDLLLIRQGIIDKSVNSNVLKKYFTPAASSFTESGIVKLSNAINSDDEHIAATSKAVKSAHSIALQASQDVSTKSLSKSANLADVADVAEVLKNLGLSEKAATRNIGNGENQIPDMSFFKSSNLEFGWQKLPSGIIIQWGCCLSAGSGSIEAGALNSFPIAFPNKCLAVTTTHTGHSPAIVGVVSVFVVNNTLFRCYRSGSGSNEVSVYYIAIGY